MAADIALLLFQRRREKLDRQCVALPRRLRIIAHDDLAALALIAEWIRYLDVDARHVEAVMTVRHDLKADLFAVLGGKAGHQLGRDFRIIVVLVERACDEEQWRIDQIAECEFRHPIVRPRRGIDRHEGAKMLAREKALIMLPRRRQHRRNPSEGKSAKPDALASDRGMRGD